MLNSYAKKSFLQIPLLYYYINLRSLIICCLFFLETYIFLLVFLCQTLFHCFSVSLSAVSELLCGERFDTFIISSAISLQTKSLASSAAFWKIFFEATLSVFVQIIWYNKESFFVAFTVKVFTYIFTNILSHIFSKRQISVNF